MLHDGRQAVVVDPGQAAPVLEALGPKGKPGSLQLAAILVTHHHGDHVGGVAQLQATTGAALYAPAHQTDMPTAHIVAEGDRLSLLGLQFEVLEVPGHTAEHIAFYSDGRPRLSQPLLFCGDTLFSGGCGRLFEGTAAQMLHSLDRLGQLPDGTNVCCAHEYTLANLRFALTVEPANTLLQDYHRHCQALRAQGQPTLPSTMAQELAINPFLRIRKPSVRQALLAHQGMLTGADEVSLFAALRLWKNNFT